MYKIIQELERIILRNHHIVTSYFICRGNKKLYYSIFISYNSDGEIQYIEMDTMVFQKTNKHHKHYARTIINSSIMIWLDPKMLENTRVLSVFSHSKEQGKERIFDKTYNINDEHVIKIIQNLIKVITFLKEQKD